MSVLIANHELYTLTDTGEIHSGKLDRILTPHVQPKGYLTVVLDGESLGIHRLVAKHFIPNPYDYPQVNHIDGNKHNNNVANLEWCSAEQNTQHALETGLRKGFVHVDVKRAMVARVLQGELIADLAPEIGNHPNVLSRMLRVQAKKDGLQDKWKEVMSTRRKLTAIKNLEAINADN